MGIFGSRNNHIELVKKMAHDANDTNVEIGEMIAFMEDNLELFNSVHIDSINLAKKILSKLSEEEMQELGELTERIGIVHSTFNEIHKQIIGLSENQVKRTQTAIDSYGIIGKG
jgi:hypothetical protein